MKPVKCPTCDLQWNIRDDAERVVTCPRCLSALNNPYPAQELTGMPSSDFGELSRAVGMSSPVSSIKPPPLPVLPIERQIHRDARVTSIGIVVIAFIIVFGILTLFTAGVSGASHGYLALIALFVVVATAIAAIVIGMRKRAPVIATAGVAPSFANYVPNPSATVLNYSPATRDPRKLSGGAFFGQVIAGIILGLVALALLAGFLSAFSNGDLVGLALLFEPAIGIALCFNPRVRGLGVGMIIAIPGGFLLLLGFCAIVMSGGGLNFH